MPIEIMPMEAEAERLRVLREQTRDRAGAPEKERPMLMSAPMVRAILAGTKTQTRRVVKQQPPAGHKWAGWCVHSTHKADEGKATWAAGSGPLLCDVRRAACPYGQPGDRLWVREAHAIVPRTAYAHSEGVQQTLRPDDPYEHDAAIYREGWTRSKGGFKWRPSIHMPRWASRITLEITSVRVERLQDISEADAMAEGIRKQQVGQFYSVAGLGGAGTTARAAYALLWNKINGPDSWDANPWVWVVEFRRVTP